MNRFLQFQSSKALGRGWSGNGILGVSGGSNRLLESNPKSYNASGLAKVIKSVVSGQIGRDAGQANNKPRANGPRQPLPC